MVFAPKTKTKFLSRQFNKNQTNEPFNKPFLIWDQGFWGILDGVLDGKKMGCGLIIVESNLVYL